MFPERNKRRETRSAVSANGSRPQKTCSNTASTLPLTSYLIGNVKASILSVRDMALCSRRVASRAAQVLPGLACRRLGDRVRSKCFIPPARLLSSSTPRLALRVNGVNEDNKLPDEPVKKEDELASRPEHEHAVISAFDLFSIGGELWYLASHVTGLQ